MRSILILFFFSYNLLWSSDATMEVTKNVQQSLPAMFIEDGSVSHTSISDSMHKMLLADMNVVSLFNLNPMYVQKDFNAPVANNGSQIPQYTLRYRLATDGSGQVHADIKLIRNADIAFEKSYILNQQEMLVFLSHTIAFDINKALGGAPMDWLKRKVLFVRMSGQRRSEIVVSDYTLTYQKVLANGGMYDFARWANREQTAFYYTSLSEFRPTIYKMNLQNGQKEKVISADGMAVCSDVSEDGKNLLLTLAPEGQPEIYMYDLSDGSKKRLTEYSGIDVNGQFVGSDSIAFVSDRMGPPNVFIKSLTTNIIKPLVFSGRNNTSVSTYKNYIVYKTREGGSTFNLLLLSLDTSNVKRLTSSGHNDFPRFSPDGEAILFIKQEGSQSSIGVIRLDINQSFFFPLKVGRIQTIDW